MCGPAEADAGGARGRLRSSSSCDDGGTTGGAQRPLELSPHECLSVVVFDWDDTLFPTSALTAFGPQKLGDTFLWVDSLVSSLLEASLAIPQSQVMILTNARSGWVQHAALRFLPKVNALLAEQASDLSVVSAYVPREERAKPDGDADPAEAMLWKRDAIGAKAPQFQEAIRDLNARAFQVMSIGDSPYDLEAAYVLAKSLQAEESYVKTVWMKPRPSPAELVRQLGALRHKFMPMLRAPRPFHQNMHLVGQPPPVACATAH